MRDEEELMNSQQYAERLLKNRGPHDALVELISKMRPDEANALLQSAAHPLPTTVAWNLLRDVLCREGAAASW